MSLLPSTAFRPLHPRSVTICVCLLAIGSYRSSARGQPAPVPDDSPAASAAPAAVPATTNVPGAEYPKLDSSLRVTFQFHAPTAQSVGLQLDKRYAMSRDQKGDWSVTTGPQVPGFHYYWIVVDGEMVDALRAKHFLALVKKPAELRYRKRESTFTKSRTSHTVKSESIGIFRKRQGRGVGSLYTHRRGMTQIQRGTIPFFIYSMVAEKMRGPGAIKDA